jgi:hypothetical protein
VRVETTGKVPRRKGVPAANAGNLLVSRANASEEFKKSRRLNMAYFQSINFGQGAVQQSEIAMHAERAPQDEAPL